MLNFKNVTLRRGPRVLIERATFSIARGDKVGVVGANGVGKSSLFAMVQGDLAPDAGEYEEPRGVVKASVAQEVEADERLAIDFVQQGDRELAALTAEIASLGNDGDGLALARLHGAFEAMNGYSAQARAGALMDGLGFAAGDQGRPVSAFSGGWRVRLALGQALMCRSDLLLLDEPTNHLDLDAVLWLESWLRNYPGTLLIVSHDREFLDRVVTRIISIEQGGIATYTGNYSSFKVERAARLAERSAAAAKQERERRHIQDFIARFRAKASKARQAQSRIKSLERMEAIAVAHADSPFEFEFGPPRRLPRPLLTLTGAAAGYQGQPIVSGATLSIQPGDRIALLGRNGAGKSTLMRALAGLAPLLAGERNPSPDLEIGYFAQHHVEQLDGAESPLWHLITQGGPELSAAPEAEQRSFLGGFGYTGDRVFEPVAPFSGGERARLVLALLVSRRPNLLLLDEPTNHLDLDMRHALSIALQDFAGAIVMVSHDRHLVRLVADSLLLVADGRIAEFDGDLDDYAAWLSRARAAAPSRESEPPGAPKSGETRESSRERRRDEAARRARLSPLRSALARAERDMDDAAARIAAAEARLADGSLYEQSAQADLEAVLADERRARGALRAAEEAWLEASAALESAMGELPSSAT